MYKAKVFISHTWLADEDTNEDDDSTARTIKVHLERHNFKAWIDHSEIRLGHQIHGRISSGLADSDCFVVLLTPLSIGRSSVREEIVRATERNIPIVVLRHTKIDLNELPQVLAKARKEVIDYSPAQGIQTILHELVQTLDRIVAAPGFRELSESNRLIHRLGLALQESAYGESFKSDMIGDVIDSIQMELNQVIQGQYSANIGPERNFLVRAPALYRTASRAFAVNLCSVSSFWLDFDSDREINTYYEAQPSNTIRLFVFRSGEQLRHYQWVLHRHFKRYGHDGAILLCSIKAHERLLQNVVTHPDNLRTMRQKDFAVLEFDRDGEHYAIEATLDSTTFDFREVRGKRYRFIDHEVFTRMLKTLAHDAVTRNKLGVLRLESDPVSDESAWERLVSFLPSEPSEALHCVFFRPSEEASVSFPTLLSQLKRELMSKVAPGIRPSWMWIGKRHDMERGESRLHLLPGEWQRRYPFVLLSSHRSSTDLQRYYVDEQHAQLRMKLYSDLQPHLRSMLHYLEGQTMDLEGLVGVVDDGPRSLSAEKRRLVFDAVEAVASQFISRIDYNGTLVSVDVQQDHSEAQAFSPAPVAGAKSSDESLYVLMSRSWYDNPTTTHRLTDVGYQLRLQVGDELPTVRWLPDGEELYDIRLLDRANCLLLSATAETTDNLDVVEELTRAHERGVRIIPIVDSKSKPKDLAVLQDINFIPLKRGTTSYEFLQTVANRLRELSKKENRVLKTTARNRSLIAIARRIQELGTQQPFRAGIIRDLLEVVVDEIDGIARGQYSTYIGIERSFLRRATQLFASASAVYAVSYDVVSRFWQAPHLRTDADDYVSRQPENSVRLFVFSDARSANDYRGDLAKHARRYGSQGAVLLCSAEAYRRRIVPEVARDRSLSDDWQDMDFGVLRFDVEGDQETIIAVLDSSKLVFKDALAAATGNGITDEISAIERIDPDKFVERMEAARRTTPGEHYSPWDVWRWKSSWEEDDDAWKGCLQSIFGSPDQGTVHLEFFVSTDSEHAERTARKITQTAIDSKAPTVQQAWFGEQNDLSVVDRNSGGIIYSGGAREERFALMLKMKDAEELRKYYDAIWDSSEQTQRVYASLDEFLGGLLDSPDTRSELKKEILKKMQSKVFAVDYVNAETFDSILTAKQRAVDNSEMLTLEQEIADRNSVADRR